MQCRPYAPFPADLPYRNQSLPVYVPLGADVAKELTAALLKSEDETKELIGAWLIFGQSFRNDEYIEQAEQLATRSVNHRRLLADVVADVLTWTENRRRAEQLLKEFFFDEDKQVREQATHVFRKIRGEEIERCRELAEQFVQSPAISERSFSFLHMLQDASCDVLDLVIGRRNDSSRLLRRKAITTEG